MNSRLLIVLGIASTMLGMYILFVSILNIQQKVDYHAGCYQSEEPVDKSFTFRNRFRQLKNSGNHARSLQNILKTSQILDNQIRPKSVELTKSVESYIQKMTLIKHHQESNINFFVQLSSSRQSYERCAKQLKQKIDFDNSKSLWTVYQTCFDRYEGLKEQMEQLQKKKNQLIDQIDQWYRQENKLNVDLNYQQQLRIIRQKYERLNGQNDLKKQKYVDELKRIQIKNLTKTSELDQSQRVFKRATLEYDICLKNLKQFKKCQDISKALKEYGYEEPVENLEKQIKSKRLMLIQMIKLLGESKKHGQKNDVINQMYKKSAQQLIQTMKLRISMGVDQMKECGCTDDTRSKLQKDLQNSKIKMNLNKKEVNDIDYQIRILQKKVKETDEIREKLVRQLTQETLGLKNRESISIQTLKQKLEVIRPKIAQYNKQINEYNKKLNDLEFECNQYKDKLGLKLSDAEEITECLKNKDFYDKLRSKAQLIIKKDAESSLSPIENIRKSLWAINYPETTQIKKMIAFGNDLDQIEKQIAQLTHKQQIFEEKISNKSQITLEGQISSTSPEEKVTIQEKEVVQINPIHQKDL